MKISQKHIQYILLLLIVVIAVCAYQFGYVKYIEKANQVKEENKTIEARINELNTKESHRAEWTEGIAESEKNIKEILAKYGPGNTPEKSIMFLRSLEDVAEMTVPNLTFYPDNSFYISNNVDGEGNPTIEMDRTTLSFNYLTSYDGLKKCVDYINNYVERMNINGFTAMMDPTTGQLTGSMVINLFSVTDESHVYSAPVVSGIDIGTDNIFGTLDLTTVDELVNELNENVSESTGENATENTTESND